MRTFLFLGILMLSTVVSAARLEFENTQGLRTGEVRQIRVFVVDDEGRRDVTSEVVIRTNPEMEQWGPNEFLISPSPYGQNHYVVRMSASYRASDDEMEIHFNDEIYVDARPHWIDFYAPLYHIPPGYSLQLSARGMFYREMNISRHGRWRAQYGTIDRFGRYWAPPFNCVDYIVFEYGDLRVSRRISVRGY